MEVKPDTASAFYLDGEGTSGNKDIEKEKSLSKSESKDTVRIISNNISKTQKNLNQKKIKISKKTP